MLWCDVLADSLRWAFRAGPGGHAQNVDVRDRFYKTPLMTAAHHGNIEVVKLLLEHGYGPGPVLPLPLPTPIPICCFILVH